MQDVLAVHSRDSCPNPAARKVTGRVEPWRQPSAPMLRVCPLSLNLSVVGPGVEPRSVQVSRRECPVVDRFANGRLTKWQVKLVCNVALEHKQEGFSTDDRPPLQREACNNEWLGVNGEVGWLGLRVCLWMRHHGLDCSRQTHLMCNMHPKKQKTDMQT